MVFEVVIIQLAVVLVQTQCVILLINMKKKVGQAGGKMKLCCIHPELKVVFKITRLDQVFEIFDEEQPALDSF